MCKAEAQDMTQSLFSQSSAVGVGGADQSNTQGQSGYFQLHLEELSPEELQHHVAAGVFYTVDNHKEHFAIEPSWLGQPRQGIIHELVKTLGKWNGKLEAYVVGFENVRSDTTLAAINEDHRYLHIDVFLSYFLYKPEEGQQLRGVVRKIGNKAAICVVFNVFTATVFAQSEEERLSWTLGEEIDFEIYSFQNRRKGPIIRGKSVATSGSSSKRTQFKDEDWEGEEDDVNNSVQPELQDEDLEEGLDYVAQDISSQDETQSSKRKKKKKKDKHRALDNVDYQSEIIEVQDLSPKKKSKKRAKQELDFDLDYSSEIVEVSQESVTTSPKKKKKHKKRRSEAEDE